MTDLEAVTDWVSGYVRAWHSNDPEEIGELFAQDAAYYPAPYDEPWRGRAAIVRQWLARRDEPGAATFSWHPVTVGPDLSIVQGVTAYPDRTYTTCG